MSLKQRLKNEFKSVALATIYFGCWVGAMFIIKNLLLLKYRLATFEWAAAIFGVLLLAKVVLILEHVPLRRIMGTRPAWVDIIARTVLYAVGVVVALALERGLRGWGEHGGFLPALEASLQRNDPEHVWVNTIAIVGSLLGYNVLTVVRRNLGDAALLRMFLTPLPREAPTDAP
jgi:hypothetical protein